MMQYARVPVKEFVDGRDIYGKARDEEDWLAIAWFDKNLK